MKAEAVPLGEKLVEEERGLDDLFAGKSADARGIEALTTAIGETRGKLRAAHLRTHVTMAKLMTPDQQRTYQRLRGYEAPADTAMNHGGGHDAAAPAQHGATHGAMNGASGASGATAAYAEAMEKMDAPMMDGIMDPDPDVAFVKGMIPHHQGAIDMARTVLEYGKDERTRAWAARIIEAQEGEIAEMQAWLAENRK